MNRPKPAIPQLLAASVCRRPPTPGPQPAEPTPPAGQEITSPVRPSPPPTCPAAADSIWAAQRVADENIEAALRASQDFDFAVETGSLSRAEICALVHRPRRRSTPQTNTPSLKITDR